MKNENMDSADFGSPYDTDLLSMVSQVERFCKYGLTFRLECLIKSCECNEIFEKGVPAVRYKLSRYNNLFTRGNSTYLWNTLSEALLHIDEDSLRFIHAFDGADHSGEDAFDILLKNRCIVSSELNECNQVLKEEKISILNPFQKVLHLTIAPGLGCNYHCVYCFEKHREQKNAMTESTCEELVRFIKNTADANPALKYVMIRWFGGEPLLYMDTISFISDQLIPYFQSANITYYSEIITNGRFLTVENAKRLRDYGIARVQLPIDGMPDYYMAQKKATRDDFEHTIKNILDSCDILPIQVRINISDEKEEALRLTEYLLRDLNLDGKIKIGIAHIRNYDMADSAEEEALHREFLEFEKQYIHEFVNNGKYSPESLALTPPMRRPANCYCICSNNFVIGPGGELYRCEHHLGRKEYSVGNISDGENYSPIEMHFIHYRHPEKCLFCSIFPVCLSGCLNYRLSMACREYKEHLFDLLLFSYRSGIIQKQSARL